MSRMPNAPNPDSPRGVLAVILDRPITALMVLVLIAVLGVVSYQRIPILLFPKGVSEPELTVSVEYPNASPYEVLEKVTKPLEDTIRAMPDVLHVFSNSRADSARVRVQFNPSADMDLAYNELSDRLERTKPSFPDEVEDIRIWRRNMDEEMPIFWLGVLYEDWVDDPFGTVDELIQPRLEAVDGVAQATIWGMVQDSIRIFVTPEKLRAHGVSLYEVVQALRRDNFTLPAGSIEQGDREFLLRIDCTLKSLDEIRAYPIKNNVKIGDVADVRVAQSYRDQVSRVNGKSSLTCVVTKESDENTVDVCRRVDAQLARIEQDPRLKGYAFKVYFDQSDMIVGALGNLKSSMTYGAFFAILVLYVFVRRISMTLMVATAIPVSLLAALVCVYFAGFTFNLISLAGFTLAIGMLVDNSVVVAENIARQRAAGESPFAAAVSGARQVALAIVASTLTTIAVFTPMVFMANGRNMRIFLGELAAPITFSLLASLLTALVFLPIATIHLSRSRGRGESPAASAYSHGSRLLSGYRRALAFVLSHRFGVTLFTIGVIQLGAYASRNLEVRFDGGEDGDMVRIEVELPRRFTLPEASEVFAELETFLLTKKDEYGFNDVSVRFRRTDGSVHLWFEFGGAPIDRNALSMKLKNDLPKIAGVEYQVGYERNEEGSIRVGLHGPESDVLSRIGDDLVRILEEIPDLTNVRTDLEEGLDELRVSIDGDRARRYGVSQETLQGIIAWGVGGQRLSDYRGEARSLPFLVEYEEPEIGNLDYLRTLDVPVDGSGTVPLASLTDYRFEKSLGSIRRKDGITSFEVKAESFDKNSYRVQRLVEDVLAQYPFPDGYGWRDAGGRNDWEEDRAEVQFGQFVGVIFVFLLMGMLFESAVLPLSVLLAIPLAIVGANLALWVTRTPLDSTAQLAFILLAGVVVNNGIVLVDRIRQVRDTGLDRREAVLTGCEQRVRPVLMTALTTMFGLVPMALPKLFANSTNTGLNYQSLAVATLGGLLVSTLLTLLVVPLFYTLFDDLGALFARVLGLLGRRRGSPPESRPVAAPGTTS